MLRKTPLRNKKVYFLKKSPLKKTELKKENLENKENWLEIRKKAFQRDKYKCIICGRKATQVHHIHLRSKRKDLMFNLNNLVCLCDQHHFHSGDFLYKEQTTLIAKKLNVTVEDLLKFAEEKEGD